MVIVTHFIIRGKTKSTYAALIIIIQGVTQLLPHSDLTFTAF